MSSNEASESEDSFYGPLSPPNFMGIGAQEPVTPRRRQDEGTFLLPSSGPRYSSPVIGTVEERAEIHRNKAAQARAREKEIIAENELALKHAAIKQMFQDLATHEISLWELLEYVFNPRYGQGRLRHHQFFSTRGHITQLLDWWMSSDNRSHAARTELDQWARNHISKVIAQEARAITNSRKLQTMRQNLDSGFVQSFKFMSIYSLLKDELAPVSIKILESLSTSRRANLHSKRRQERTKIVSSPNGTFIIKVLIIIQIITVVILSCLGEYSHANNLSKRILALYLYASGAQRQVISVLSSMGICESYTNLVTRNKRRKREGDPEMVSEQSGTLHQLSDSMRLEAREIAATGLFSVVYDNININVKSAEQIVGRHGMPDIYV